MLIVFEVSEMITHTLGWDGEELIRCGMSTDQGNQIGGIDGLYMLISFRACL